MKCLCCGADGTGEAFYPYDDGKLDTSKPLPKLLTIEAQPTTKGEPFKLLILCHDCWHKLEGDNGPDMWTAQEYYEALNPITPFTDLPEQEHQRPDGSIGAYVEGAIPIWVAEHYQKPQAG